MLKQYISGLQTTTVNVIASDADLAKIAAIMEGSVETYKSAGQGGTAGTLPATLNKKTFILGAKGEMGARKSTQVSFPHVKPASQFTDISASIVGQFTIGYEPDKVQKCDYAKMKFDA
ncbi:hypothetical protein [Campylobacter geochelonis]|uniref:hypothetical protein n=1 Tax=Campylobacter geochelonis TaxID=1780362 RepID=UPI000770A563|nr:hypothetical protein [Campylobacter geochelonis]CZE48931.1 Uncharacterised protein [Campylobacter geochelonis]CZE49909.1 Uncharacterised protein [Campylobacter geochelonis]